MRSGRVLVLGRAAAPLLALVLASSGCASLENIDRFSVSDGCGSDCDGSANDGTVGDDVAASDAGDAADAADVSTDGPLQDVTFTDGPCGPTNTVANCGACGNACDTTYSLSPSCNGATCSYAGCMNGHADCDAAAPDLDGCECPTPACCGDGCQVVHSNGIGQAFYDCQPLGTHNMAQANEVCAAFTGDVSLCQNNVIGCTGAGHTVCTPTATVCACWGYQGGGALGHVSKSSTTTCACPTGSDPTWN